MDKNKYLIHKDILISQLIFLIRKRIRLSHEESLYIFINDTIPQTTKLISEIYSEHKDEDGFLYIVYSCENTFGNL
jgi:GABA(A) receptor-associated protein